MRSSGSQIAIVLAVFEPDRGMLELQLASIAAQSGVELVVLAVIADRASGPLMTELALKHGLRIELLLPEERTISYDSFALGLEAALATFPDAAYLAFADQDDIWAPEKLARCRTVLERTGKSLVHSDARVVDQQGHVITRSLHRMEQRLKPRGLRDLLAENCATGMTMLMPRATAEAAVPFPKQAALYFHHDLWVALVAEALEGVTCIDAPLVDYRQHDGNVVGAKEEKQRAHTLLSTAWRRHWAGTYYVASYLAKSLYLRMEDVDLSGAHAIDRRKLSALKPYLSQRGLGTSHLGDALVFLARGRVDLARRNVIFTAVRWARAFRCLRKIVVQEYLPALAEFDRLAFSAVPGVVPTEFVGLTGCAKDQGSKITEAKTLLDPRCTARFDVATDPGRPAGTTIFVPSLNPSEIFAGIATALDIGMGLAARGHAVRFVATDLPIANEAATRAFLATRGPGNGESTRRVAIFCGQTEKLLTLGADETLVATAWWTAHLARALIDRSEMTTARFYYLIQDFEPGFYPWGDAYAGALASYHLSAIPIFNSRPLADYFAEWALLSKIDCGLVFHPAIDTSHYARLIRPKNAVRRIAVYGRPEVARNLFGTSVEALDRFFRRSGIRPNEVEVMSVGLKHEDVVFETGHRMRSLGKIPWSEYPAFLTRVDIGLSLMLSPHPSHPPIEMAAAGARVVTNSFGPKCLAGLTPAIASVPPEAEAVSNALYDAWCASPLPQEAREFDLTGLGHPLCDVIDRLSLLMQNRSVPLGKTA